MPASKQKIDLKPFLDEKAEQFNSHDFIEFDPISIPHRFSSKGDIEISAFLTATISWGNRKSIIKNASQMMMLMDDAPLDFVLHFSESDLINFKSFKHRTFNASDLIVFIRKLHLVYKNEGSLEKLFENRQSHEEGLQHFPELFLGSSISHRAAKHVASIGNGSAAKRLNMFLRWMVRKDKNHVDFGIWNSIKMSELFIPLDVHTANTARNLGLLERRQNDWKAVLELTQKLRDFDQSDPVRYDYALFGLGAFNKIK